MDVDVGILSEFEGKTGDADLLGRASNVAESSGVISDLIHDGLIDSLLSDRLDSTNFPSPGSELADSLNIGPACSFSLGLDPSDGLFTLSSTTGSRSPSRSSEFSDFNASTRRGFMFDDLVDLATFDDTVDTAKASSAAGLSAALDTSVDEPMLCFDDILDKKDVKNTRIGLADSTVGARASTAGPHRGKTIADFSTPSEFEAYRNRRRKNNLASKRSRSKAKQKTHETEQEVIDLREENAALRRQLQTITEAFGRLQERMVMEDGAV